MSYHYIDGSIYFKVVCGDPANSGQRVGADAAPTFKVYEQNGTTALTTSTTSAFAGETGVYAGSFVAAGVTGYEEGKCYTIVVSATIGGHDYAALVEFEIDYATVDMTAQAATNMNAWFNNDGNALPAGARVGNTLAITDPLGVAVPGSYASGTVGYLIGNSGFTAAGIRSAMGLATANMDTQLGGIAGYIDTEVAAIKAKTDQLVFDSGNVRVNVKMVNTFPLVGNGSTIPWGPA